MFDFDKCAQHGKCEVCGKETDVVARMSSIGPMIFSCCKACLAADAEPYERMGSYIACAGEWPKDIGAAYQVQVRRLLGIHGKTEEEFSRDVSGAMREIGTPAVSAPRVCEIALPDGTTLQASAHDDTDYPGINIYLLSAGGERELICFAEHNPEKPLGHQLCIGAYRAEVDEPYYYDSYNKKC